jgi:N-methylhydantoinase A
MTTEIQPEEVGARLVEDFHHLHQRLYGYTSDSAEVELVTLHLAASAALTRLELAKLAASETPPHPRSTRDVYFSEAQGWVECAVYDRTALGAGAVLDGPAIIEQLDTTIVVLPNQRASSNDSGSLIITDPAVRVA